MFLPPNVTNDQSGMNPLLAAISGASPASQPAPAAAPVPAAAATPAQGGGGLLASLFGGGAGASTGTGNPIGNALVNSGGHFLLPLLGSLMGGMTPQQQARAQALATARTAGLATAEGFQGLDAEIQKAGGNQNKGLHAWLNTKSGMDFLVANGDKAMGTVKDYLAASAPDAGMTADQKNFEYFLKRANIDDGTAQQLAAANKAGVLKIVPRTITRSDGTVETTGQYDAINLATRSVTPINAGAAAAATTSAPATPTATAPGVPASGAAALTAPAPNTPASPNASIVPAAPAGTAARPSATIAETAGPVGKGVLAGGSLLSNVNPAFYPKETAKNAYTVDRIEATVPKVLSTLKGSRGSNAVIKPLQDLMALDKASSPQEQLQKMIAAAQWVQDTYAYNEDIMKNRPGTDAAKAANSEQGALQQLYDTLPPMHTQIETSTDAQGKKTSTTVVGMSELLDQMSKRGFKDSPVGKYVGDLPQTAQKYVDTGKQMLDQAGTAVGLPEPPASNVQGPPPKLKPGESAKYGNAIIKRLN